MGDCCGTSPESDHYRSSSYIYICTYYYYVNGHLKVTDRSPPPKGNAAGHCRRRWLQGATWGPGQPAMARDTGSNLTRWSRNSSRMLPVGPLRFLATMISAMLRGYSWPGWVCDHSSSVVYRSSRWMKATTSASCSMEPLSLRSES